MQAPNGGFVFAKGVTMSFCMTCPNSYVYKKGLCCTKHANPNIYTMKHSTGIDFTCPDIGKVGPVQEALRNMTNYMRRNGAAALESEEEEEPQKKTEVTTITYNIRRVIPNANTMSKSQAHS